MIVLRSHGGYRPIVVPRVNEQHCRQASLFFILCLFTLLSIFYFPKLVCNFSYFPRREFFFLAF